PGGDHRVALPAYERRMRAYASRWQRGANPGHFLAPASAWGLWLRDRLLAARPVQSMLVRSTGSLATDLDLPDYPAQV
ncbi:FAD-dependent oxidoreductase, partial [Micromonospora globispora]